MRAAAAALRLRLCATALLRRLVRLAPGTFHPGQPRLPLCRGFLPGAAGAPEAREGLLERRQGNHHS